MNAFEVLGLREGLDLSEEEVRDAFRQKASAEHPDSGGDEVAFSEIQAARELLLSPSRRLKEWIRIKNLPVDNRGQIDSGLIELFEEVSRTGSEAEAVIKENENAQAALVRAMVEVKMISQRERVKELLAKIGSAIESREGLFPEIEKGERDAGTIMRDLTFLEKWRATLKGIFSKLL